jgi:hypothetical protein
MTNQELSIAIATQQSIQMAHLPSTKEWQEASDKLQPLFAEAAKRQQAGHIVKCLF